MIVSTFYWVLRFAIALFLITELAFAFKKSRGFSRDFLWSLIPALTLLWLTSVEIKKARVVPRETQAQQTAPILSE